MAINLIQIESYFNIFSRLVISVSISSRSPQSNDRIQGLKNLVISALYLHEQEHNALLRTMYMIIHNKHRKTYLIVTINC